MNLIDRLAFLLAMACLYYDYQALRPVVYVLVWVMVWVMGG